MTPADIAARGRVKQQAATRFLATAPINLAPKTRKKVAEIAEDRGLSADDLVNSIVSAWLISSEAEASGNLGQVILPSGKTVGEHIGETFRAVQADLARKSEQRRKTREARDASRGAKP